MIVISDSSPLNYLVLIGQADLLAKLYGEVVIPPAVHDELQRESTPVVVRQWVARPPGWLKLHKAAVSVDSSLGRLGAGEREAIALAEQLRANAILIDERDGRRLAERRHLTVIGTLQILDTAAEEGMIDFPTVLAELQRTTFRVSTRLLSLFLERAASRKRKQP
jgi:predicted nucleic acid-binding protein